MDRIFLVSAAAVASLAEANPGARHVVTGSGSCITLGEATYVSDVSA